jgi:hypothetical protein
MTFCDADTVRDYTYLPPVPQRVRFRAIGKMGQRADFPNTQGFTASLAGWPVLAED